MLHESPSWSLQFEASWPHFAASGYRCLSIDTPGFGMSDVPPKVPTIEDYASVVPYVMDAAGVSTAAAVGHHTGSKIALEAAGQFPDRISKVICHGFGLYPEESKAWIEGVMDREQAPPELKADGSHLSEAFVRRAALGGSLEVVQRGLLAVLTAGPLYWYGHHAAFGYDPVPRLKSVKQPVLFLSNTGEMIHEHTLRAHSIRPNAPLVVIESRPGAVVIDEQPADWVAAIVSFLRGS